MSTTIQTLDKIEAEIQTLKIGKKNHNWLIGLIGIAKMQHQNEIMRAEINIWHKAIEKIGGAND